MGKARVKEIFYVNLAVLIGALFVFWSFLSTNEGFRDRVASEGALVFLLISTIYMLLNDLYIKGRNKELMYRFMIFLILAINVIISRWFYHNLKFDDHEILFITISSLPYMIFSPYLFRKFISAVTNATSDEVTWVENGFIVNRVFYLGIALFSGALGYGTHLLI